jgi:tetratricopeptide (TPR) repeat protein
MDPRQQSPEERISKMNRQVAEYQRAGLIEKGVELADEAFFAALEELPEGHFLRAQSARNRGIMYQMAGNQEEAFKTLFVAFDFYQKALEQCVVRRERLESDGDLRRAKEAAEEQVRLARDLEQLRQVLGG